MKIKPKLILFTVIFLLGGLFNLFFSTAIHRLLTRNVATLKFLPITVCFQSLVSSKQHLTLFLLIQGFFLLAAVLFSTANLYPYKSDLDEITPDIKTPKAVGQFQHGSARWLTDAEKNRAFESYVLNPHNNEIKRLIDTAYEDIDFMKTERSAKDESTGTAEKNFCPNIPDYTRGGIVIGKKQEGEAEKIYYIGEDSHLLCIGATRSGKSRCLVIPSICSLGLAGESIVVSDPKAELYHYFSDFLKKLGYEVLALDFKTPAKSQRYNLLQPIIEAVECDDTDRAERAALTLADGLHENFKKRAAQAEHINQLISASPYPTLVCGDFNSLPSSYVYQTVKGEKLNDGFQTCGHGYMYTFRYFKHLLRIDYILHSSEFQGVDYFSPDLEYSDHNPVVMRMRL